MDSIWGKRANEVRAAALTRLHDPERLQFADGFPNRRASYRKHLRQESLGRKTSALLYRRRGDVIDERPKRAVGSIQVRQRFLDSHSLRCHLKSQNWSDKLVRSRGAVNAGH